MPPGPETGTRACEVRPDGRSASVSLCDGRRSRTSWPAAREKPPWYSRPQMSTRLRPSSTDSPAACTIPAGVQRLPPCESSVDTFRWRSSWRFASACSPFRAPAVAAPPLPTPAGWPLRGAPVVQRGFALPAVVWGSGHRGVDLSAKAGEAVLAAASGTVVFAGSIAGKPVVSIDHGSVRTTYEPVITTLSVGKRVALGQVIGVLGTGGHCPGCLHWGLREGKSYLDPLLLLGGRGGRLRLVPESQREVVAREAQARALAAASTTQSSAIMTPAGRPGSHGFLHPVAGAVSSSVRDAAPPAAQDLETARRH